MAKLWQKSYDTEKRIEEFTVGDDAELDLQLAPFDVLGSLAHIEMLESINLLEKEELSVLQKELKNIYQNIQKGDFSIDEGVEDVHSQVEMLLTKALGDVGKKIHSGRSRNDQVLVDLKLYTRHRIEEVVESTERFFAKLTELAEKHKDVLIPGYTHLQVAMPSSFGLWFSAYAESLTDDLNALLAGFKLSNKNPLGSAAGYGSSFPLNRTMTTELLGFEGLHYNVVYAQLSRGRTEKMVSTGLASIASTLGRMSMDTCLYMSQNFGFLTFPDELTTGSSIMPHKKNPDVFELIRGKCSQLQALPNELQLLVNNLPSGYHREMQLLKEHFFPAFDTIIDSLDIATYMFDNIIIKDDILKDSKYDYLFTVETVNKMVLDGIPFRDAYKQVGEVIQSGNYKADRSVNHTHEGSIGNLCLDEVTLNFNESVKAFNFAGIRKSVDKLIK